jgi:hypothetical protein
MKGSKQFKNSKDKNVKSSPQVLFYRLNIKFACTSNYSMTQDYLPGWREAVRITPQTGD